MESVGRHKVCDHLQSGSSWPVVTGGDFTGRQAHHKMFFVYLLQSEKDDKYYIGITENIERRIKDHNSGKVSSTKSRRPLRLIYYEAYLNKSDGEGREKFLKSGSGHRYIKKQLKNFLEENLKRDT